MKKRLPFVVLIVAIFALSSCARKPAALDLTGSWEGTATAESVPSVPLEAEFNQTGSSLSGSMTLGGAVQADLTGTVEGQQVAFGFSAEIDVAGTTITVVYALSGTVSGDTLSGTFTTTADVGSSQGTFELSRQ